VLLASILQSILALLLRQITGLQSFQEIQSFPGLLLAALTTGVTLIAVGYFRFVRPGVVPLTWFGFSRNRAARYLGNRVWLAHLLTGIGGWMLVLLVTIVVQVVLSPIGVQQTQLLGFTWVSELSPLQFLAVVLVGAVLAAVGEEFYFRGILFRGYLEAKGPVIAYLVPSLVFGSLHMNAQAFLPLMALGLVLAWLYRATGSLVPGMIAHGINNTLAFVAVYFKLNGPGGT
jgi:membrane protease YdiL (CAAX protease family)